MSLTAAGTGIRGVDAGLKLKTGSGSDTNILGTASSIYGRPTYASSGTLAMLEMPTGSHEIVPYALNYGTASCQTCRPHPHP
jgi:hypothetical protein